MKLKRDLSFFDVTNIVVGSIIGADIYIASAVTAGLVGPLAIFAWVIAGAFAIVLALVFAYCSYYVPKVGGPFAFVTRAFDSFYGFLTGWSLWIAELIALPIFAIAFTQYLGYFLNLEPWQDILIKGVFIFGITTINIVGVRAAGKLNDVLTLLKLSPLVMFILAGFYFVITKPQGIIDNYTPLAPMGVDNFGAALVLIFWAYVGFEIGTLPASEVKEPKRTIPKAITTGIMIVLVFYLLTNFVLFGITNWTELAETKVPLVYTGTAMLGTAGAIIIGIGALISVSGSNESGTLGTSRLSYAMAINGLLPRFFSKTHRKFKTPYVALMIQGSIAFILCNVAGLTSLISFSVFNLAFAFFFVCLALLMLKKKSEHSLRGQTVLPLVGMAICAYLFYSTSTTDKIIGSIVILAGIPIYAFFSPKADIHHLKDLFLAEEEIFARRLERKEKLLAHFVIMCHRLYSRMRKKESL